MSDGGKGSAPRPFSVSQEEYNAKFDAIFGKKKKTVAQEFDEKVIMKNDDLDEETILGD